MLAVMVNLSYGAPAFVAPLVPVKNMTAELLFGIVSSVLEVIHNAGGQVFCLMSDDLSVNQKTFKMIHQKFNSLGISSITNENVSLLFLILHNWCTEKTQSLEFKDPETVKTFPATWSDLKKIYKEECDDIIKETKLDYTTLHPQQLRKAKSTACS